MKKLRTIKDCFIGLCLLLLLPFFLLFARMMRGIPTKESRFRKKTLQTPIVFYKHETTGRTVVVVGTLHIGEKEYYEALQNFLDGRTEDVVLYESTKSSTSGGPAFEGKELLVYQTYESNQELTKKVTGLLGLVSQRELEYRDHWVNTDVSMNEIISSLAAAEADTEDTAKPLLEHSHRQDPLFQWVFDLALTNFGVVSKTIALLNIFSSRKKREDAIVIDSRNKIAIDAILKHAETRDVTAIWGCGHLSGIEKALQKEGFRIVRREWFNVYHSKGYTFWAALKTIYRQVQVDGVTLPAS